MPTLQGLPWLQDRYRIAAEKECGQEGDGPAKRWADREKEAGELVLLHRYYERGQGKA